MDITNAQAEACVESCANLESIFAIHYGRVTRAIAMVTGDRSQAEELAVEVFLRWSRRQNNANPEAWLYRAAANLAIDALRKRRRHNRLNKVFPFRQQPTPEDIHSANQERGRVREILSRMDFRQAELLVLWADGFTYDELATALNLNPSSVGSLLGRAQRNFRKEYISQYGPQ